MLFHYGVLWLMVILSRLCGPQKVEPQTDQRRASGLAGRKVR